MLSRKRQADPGTDIMSRRLLPYLAVLATTSPVSGAVELERAEGGKVVRVVGLDVANLEALRQVKWDAERWAALLAVRLDRERTSSDDTPAMLGSYAVRDGALRFEPRFPFAIGTRYRVVFNPARLPRPPANAKPLTMRFTDLRLKRPRTVVTQVYPT